MVHQVPPKTLPGFPDAYRTAPKTPREGGLRARWKDDNRIFEWNYQHGRVEAYDLRGNHLGEFDPYSGVRIKGPEAGRKVEP